MKGTTLFLNPQDHSAHPETVSLPRQKLFNEFNLVYLELSWSKEPYLQSQATYNLLFTPAELTDANILWELSNLLYTFGAADVSKSCDEEAVFWYQEALTCLDQKVEWETDTSPQKAKLIRIITPVLVQLKQFSSAEHYIALLL
ncbi:hypothetical protein BLNAU_15212 [Blattamonas nauphoetae]|uniref:Uncharacterized protein n=1 Tax=Blattamonas nauphoetae TaxID=2049346 RepID=A0ABQ9XEQ8_9EUKA|nr:hypothetical protein BLNAU_15212 [Blattamonas nauphoetae]